jgi:hypothetical protein
MAEHKRAGPEGDRGRYELIERVRSASGQGAVHRAVLRSAVSGGEPGAAPTSNGRTGGAGGAGPRAFPPPGTVVSLKQVPRQAPGAARIEEVHAAVARRRHPALGRQVEVFRADAGALCVVAVWVDGTTLAERARDATVREVLGWCRPVAEALDFLHADLDGDGPLLHRDVKPHNVIVRPGGGAVLIDPGLARTGPSSVTGTPYGTPGYVPPECASDPAGGSPASDRWQLAATLVAALLGEPPGWVGGAEDVRAELVRRAEGEVARPADLADAVLAMLAADPGGRPASAAGWMADVHVAAAPPVGAAEPGRRRSVAAAVGPALRRWPATGTGRRAAVLASGVLLAVVAGTVAGAGPLPPGPWRDGGDPGGQDQGGGSPPPVGATTGGTGPPVTAHALVDARTTSGMHVDDQRSAYLTDEPRHRCRAHRCAVPGGTLPSGTEVTLTCRTAGERMTNGNAISPVDDENPILHESDVWFGVEVDDGPAGLLSSVWIHLDDRNPTGLPFC